jgi:hypothetical protein
MPETMLQNGAPLIRHVGATHLEASGVRVTGMLPPFPTPAGCTISHRLISVGRSPPQGRELSIPSSCALLDGPAPFRIKLRTHMLLNLQCNFYDSLVGVSYEVAAPTVDVDVGSPGSLHQALSPCWDRPLSTSGLASGAISPGPASTTNWARRETIPQERSNDYPTPRGFSAPARISDTAS